MGDPIEPQPGATPPEAAVSSGEKPLTAEQIAQDEVINYFAHRWGQRQKRPGDQGADFDMARCEAYINQARQGKFFDTVTFSGTYDGNPREATESSPYDYFKGFAGYGDEIAENSPGAPELIEDARRQEEDATKIARAIEKLKPAGTTPPEEVAEAHAVDAQKRDSNTYRETQDATAEQKIKDEIARVHGSNPLTRGSALDKLMTEGLDQQEHQPELSEKYLAGQDSYVGIDTQGRTIFKEERFARDLEPVVEKTVTYLNGKLAGLDGQPLQGKASEAIWQSIKIERDAKLQKMLRKLAINRAKSPNAIQDALEMLTLDYAMVLARGESAGKPIEEQKAQLTNVVKGNIVREVLGSKGFDAWTKLLPPNPEELKILSTKVDKENFKNFSEPKPEPENPNPSDGGGMPPTP